MNNRKIIFFSGIIYFILFTGCSTNSSIIDKGIRDQNAKPELLFVSVLMEKDSTGKITITGKEINVVEGSIKPVTNKTVYLENEYIICSFNDKNGNLVKQMKYPNPLKKTVEFVNDNGALEMKTVEIKRDWLNFRIEYNQIINKIIFEKKDLNGVNIIGILNLK